MIRRLALFVALSLACASRSIASEWVIPGVASVRGANGTHFVSELTITNLSDVATTARIHFISSAGSPAPRSYTLLARESISFRNPLEGIFGISHGGGALAVMSTARLSIRATTFNDSPDGTYGLALPVVESTRLLRSSERAASYWVAQSTDLSRGFRTNVGVVFPEPTGGSANITLYSSNGQVLATRAIGSNGPSFIQEPLTAYSSGQIDIGRVEITVTRGAATGYASVVDNVTGDGSLFPFERAPSGETDLVLSGVARSSGAFGTFFQSDVRLANPGAAPVSVAVRLHRPNEANHTATPVTIVLAPGEIHEYPDILGTLFQAPLYTIGALRFTSSAPIVVLGRTSNVGANGTFGAQQFPTSYGDLIEEGSRLVLAGTRQNNDYRTNVGISSGRVPVTYRVALQSPLGAVIKEVEQNLTAYSWTQWNVAELFSLTNGVPDDSRIVITPLEGALTAYSSTIDNRSGDAVVSSGTSEIWNVGVYGAGSGGRGGVPGFHRIDDGISPREYLLYVPATYRETEPARLVFALGGQGMSADLAINYQWRAIADAENLLVFSITPSSSGPGYANAYDWPEFTTIERAYESIRARYNVAVKHIYFWGFSAGAHVSYMLGLNRLWSNRLAAIAIQAGAIEAAATRISPPSWPPQPEARRLPIHISCGTLDTAGSAGGLIGALRRNRDMLLGAGYPVQTREVEGQGHTYTVLDVDAAWEFLERQRR